MSFSKSIIRVSITSSSQQYIIKAIIRKYLSIVQLSSSYTKSLETLTSLKSLREDSKIISKQVSSSSSNIEDSPSQLQARGQDQEETIRRRIDDAQYQQFRYSQLTSNTIYRYSTNLIFSLIDNIFNQFKIVSYKQYLQLLASITPSLPQKIA